MSWKYSAQFKFDNNKIVEIIYKFYEVLFIGLRDNNIILNKLIYIKINKKII